MEDVTQTETDFDLEPKRAKIIKFSKNIPSKAPKRMNSKNCKEKKSKKFEAKNNQKSCIQSVYEGKKKEGVYYEKPFQCQKCDKSFDIRAQLKIHASMVHEGKRPFKCNICKAAFSTKTNQKRHVALVKNL